MENDNTTKKDLINGDEFNTAIDQAADLKKEILTSVKSRNKNNYNGFYDLMVMTNREIEGIIAKKKKDRSADETEKLKKFKKDTSLMYKTVCDLLVPETLDEGEMSKYEKMVYKFALSYRMLNYVTKAVLGCSEFDKILLKYGLSISAIPLDMDNEVFANEQVRKDITEYIETGRNIKHETDKKNEEITDVIYTSAVPMDLQFDKSTNPTGIKISDFTKLVDIKTKILMANNDDNMDKVTKQANDLAGDKTFEIARAKLVQEKIIEMIPEEGDIEDDEECQDE